MTTAQNSVCEQTTLLLLCAVGLAHELVDLPTRKMAEAVVLTDSNCRRSLVNKNLHKWGLAQSPSSDCGQQQTMNHIVDTCPLTTVEGGLNLLHEADDDEVMWLEYTATAACAK